MSDGVNFMQFPPWDQMNFSSDCKVWGSWLGVVLTPNPSSPGDSIGPAFTTSIELFTAALPLNATIPNNTTLREYHSQILDWYIFNSYAQPASVTYGPWNLTSEFFTNALLYPVLNCTTEYCQAMAMQGNPDLIGIGVFISYIIEAALSTTFLAAFTAWHIRQSLRSRMGEGPSSTHPGAKSDAHAIHVGSKRVSLAQRTIDSFRGSLNSFLSSTMLISTAMLCASLYLCVSGMGNQAVLPDTSDLPYHTSAIYDMLLSFRASFFSVLPVLLLYSLTTPGMGSQGGLTKDGLQVWMRRIVLIVIWILSIVLTFLSPRGNPDYNDRQNDTAYDPCNVRGGPVYWQSAEEFKAIILVAPAVWMFITAFLATGFGIPVVANSRWIRGSRPLWRFGVAWAICGTMWAILFCFFALRSKILHNAGSSDSENAWSFGQVLALVTWVPTVTEFCYIFIWESHETHLPPGVNGQGQHLAIPASHWYSVVELDPYLIAHESASEGLYQEAGHMTATTLRPINPEEQSTPHVYHDSGGGLPRTPWQQWRE
ncbi:uncharacterized protein C8A04DRAFT_32540 [Dichotomopilus funicola]|uniref:Uncharacterized protein n=1 Tax=Dichotomopilus funicola TaxID=1934379 RepID=A0AAN6UW10_9PEZI|nr:hypothetical protein C8A04DRAFT_32540 [Dichotomopilus funicola]